MGSALLYVCEMLALLAARLTLSSSGTAQSQVDDTPSTCSLKLHPSGACGDAGECPYQITVPPLTIQLPKQLQLLETTMKELQMLQAQVKELRRTCADCRPQADQALRGDVGATLTSGPNLNLSGSANIREGVAAGPGQLKDPEESNSLKEMQQKMNRMSISLKNARRQVDTLQGRVDELSVTVSLKDVEAMVNSKMENITTVNEHDTKCSNPCPLTQPQAQTLMLAARDCSDYNTQDLKNGVRQVMPDAKFGMFNVSCDVESFGGGWTVIQHRLNGSINFNRSWEEYKRGFGDLKGEFWLGNDYIHLLTKAKDMVLRIELEDFDGVREYAKYDQFYVANEYLRYRLSVSGYSGTAGDALHYGKHYNHDHKFFTTPDKDNDMYPSGNCGSYYSSGWWFDACMSANLNGKYYKKRYKGVRNGIFWGTWRNMTSQIYPTNYRQAFKTVRMMIRPKNYAP